LDQQSIRGLLQFTGTKIDKLTLVPNAKKEPTASLALTADLTPELAEQMRCREAIFRADGKPHPHISRLDIDGILRDVTLTLPRLDNEDGLSQGQFGADWYSPEDIASFKVDVDGMIVRLSMLIRIKGRYLELVDFLAKINTERFDIAIRSRQQEFDWSGKVGGIKVDMSDGATVEGPLFGGHHATLTNEDGEVVAEVNAEREPAIPDAREMGERRERRRKTRGELGQESDAEIQRRMKAVEVEEPVGTVQ
jgi:hypothetical protein